MSTLLFSRSYVTASSTHDKILSSKRDLHPCRVFESDTQSSQVSSSSSSSSDEAESFSGSLLGPDMWSGAGKRMLIVVKQNMKPDQERPNCDVPLQRLHDPSDVLCSCQPSHGRYIDSPTQPQRFGRVSHFHTQSRISIRFRALHNLRFLFSTNKGTVHIPMCNLVHLAAHPCYSLERIKGKDQAFVQQTKQPCQSNFLLTNPPWRANLSLLPIVCPQSRRTPSIRQHL